VIEAETGAVLYERNADLARYPASLTKVMTLYLTFEAIASKKLSLNDQLTISAHAAGQDPSRLDVAAGTRIKVEDAIRAMTTKSANDAACAIAETLANGSEAQFAQQMTAKARALGLTRTTFVNASGLPQDGHISSARDLALLCKALVRDFPEQYRYFSASTFDFRGTRYPNQNRFLHTYYGADGIKTGFVNASGHNLAASAVRGGKRLITIVLGGDTQSWTREHATRLLDVSYAKIDPSLVMVASNAANAAPDANLASALASASLNVSVNAGSNATAAPAAPVVTDTAAPAPEATYATPAGAVTVTAPPAIPLPNATANLTAFAAAASAAKLPAGSVPPASNAAANAAQAAAPSAPVQSSPSRVTVATGTSANPAAQAPAAKPAAALPSAAQPAAAPMPAPAPAAPAAEKTEPTAATETQQQSAVTTNSQGGDWSVQVGLFRDATIARRRGEEARNRMPLQLRGADLVVGRALDGVHVTSRISHLSEQDARAACSELQRGRVPCVVVPPGRPIVVATN